MLTKEEFILITQALHDLAENQDISHKQAKEILEKIKSRQKNIFSVYTKYNVTKKAF